MEVTIDEGFLFMGLQILFDGPDSGLFSRIRTVVVSVEVSSIDVLSVIASIDSIRVDAWEDLEDKFVQKLICMISSQLLKEIINKSLHDETGRTFSRVDSGT